MIKSMLRITMSSFFCLLMFHPTFAQNQISAIAYPVDNITIDGDLNDWTTDNLKYMINYYHGNELENAEDFTASFMVGYNESEGAIYVAIEVIDDEYVLDGDALYLYFDRLHHVSGSLPFYFEAFNNEVELAKKSSELDPHHIDITVDKQQMKVKRSGNRTNYEWKVELGHKVKKNTVFGFDHFLIDKDSGEEEASLLWKDGFGKSSGAQKMGHVILLEKNALLGQLEGRIGPDSLIKDIKIDEVLITSMTNPNFWLTAVVDSTGVYTATIPQGKYEISVVKRFTSPIYSAGFKQNTRKLSTQTKNNIQVDVQADKTTKAKNINLEILAQPKMPVATQDKLPIEYLELKEIEDFIKEWQAYFEIPAVSIALIRDNKLFFNESYGFKNVKTKTPVTHETLFEAASISKSIFATIVLQLAEEKIIDLDKPLYEYLPFPNIEKDERSKLLTARIILNHQSGLPNWAWNGPGTWKNGGDIQLNFEPGTRFGYSGEAFNYLGRVVEKITDKKLTQLFEEKIATPFGLENTFSAYSDKLSSKAALGYYHQYPQHRYRLSETSPASSVFSCAEDLSNYVLGLMNEKILSKASYELIYSTQTVLEKDQKIYDPEIPQYVSHGFFVQDTEDGKLIAHGGNNGDFDCKFAYNKDKKLAYIIFTNSNLGDEFLRKLELFLLRKN